MKDMRIIIYTSAFFVQKQLPLVDYGREKGDTPKWCQLFVGVYPPTRQTEVLLLLNKSLKFGQFGHQYA